jgi:4-alpha-glucanotransferase
MQQGGFSWWVARVRRAMQLYDLIRLDHFRGFEAYWAVPASDETAINGQWVKAPGEALFATLRRELGVLPFVAEDLGMITPEVDALRMKFEMPGMKILQFGFGNRGAHSYLPHLYEENAVVYTGTHDNNTTLGWWVENTSEEERLNVQTYLGNFTHEAQVVWAMIREAEASVARVCILPMQDVLHLGSSARMNTPSLPDGNWSWRYEPDALHPDFSRQLAVLMEMTDRDGWVNPDLPDSLGPPEEQGTED